jgi:hypothetical protein
MGACARSSVPTNSCFCHVQDVGSAAEVKRIPTYQCYFDGELVDVRCFSPMHCRLATLAF